MSKPSEEIRKAAKQLHIRLHLEGFELDRVVIEEAFHSQREAAYKEALERAATKVNEIFTWDMWFSSSVKQEVLRASIQQILSLLPAKTKEGK